MGLGASLPTKAHAVPGHFFPPLPFINPQWGDGFCAGLDENIQNRRQGTNIPDDVGNHIRVSAAAASAAASEIQALENQYNTPVPGFDFSSLYQHRIRPSYRPMQGQRLQIGSTVFVKTKSMPFQQFPAIILYQVPDTGYSG